MTAPLIGFEGPIAAGKTTLARLLAEHTGYELVLEQFDENEFLSDFYADRSRWSLPMQLWFLNERHKQLTDIARQPHTPVVADYTSLKNDVFASLLLQSREWRLYSGLSSSLASAIRHPDVIVYVDAPNQVLLNRIRERRRAYEAHIDAPYLDGLRAAYEAKVGSTDDVTVIRRDTSTFLATDPRALNAFFAEILHAVATPP